MRLMHCEREYPRYRKNFCRRQRALRLTRTILIYLTDRFTVTHHSINVHIGDSLRLRALAVKAFQP